MYMFGTSWTRIRGKLLTIVLAVLGVGAMGIIPASASGAPVPVDAHGCTAHIYITDGKPAYASVDGLTVTVREDVPVGWTISWVNNGSWRVIKVGGSLGNAEGGLGAAPGPIMTGQTDVFLKYREGFNNTVDLCMANVGVTLNTIPTPTQPMNPQLAKLYAEYAHYHDRYLSAVCKGIGKPRWQRAIAINGYWHDFHRNRIQRRIEAGIMQDLFSAPEGARPLPKWKDVFPGDCAGVS
jgi:hypothetical protein